MKIDLEIARIAHEAVREFCSKKKLPELLAWDELPEDFKENAVSDVKTIKAGNKIIGYKEYKKADNDKMVKLFTKTVKAEIEL